MSTTTEATRAVVERGITSVTMPAGDYWVGDPCYTVPEDRWIEWLERADYMSADAILFAELDGLPVLGASTAYGDGSYELRGGAAYPYPMLDVDAGLIGLVPVALAETTHPRGVVKHTFHQPFKVTRTEGGTIRLGRLTIQTGD